MKKLLFSIAIVSLSVVSALAQVKTSTTTGQPGELAATVTLVGGHARVLGHSGRNQSETKDSRPAALATGDVNGKLKNASLKRSVSARPDEHVNDSTNVPAATRPRTANDPTTPLNNSASPVALSQIYRIGIGDVLDVQLVDKPSTKSTLFTVLDGGVLDYPLAGDPLRVVGLTADEIAVRLRASLKVFENPRVIVRVRDYVSHSVSITGLVASPGAKFLRREAIPFYVVLAEAQPRAEATRATISRSGETVINLDLNDQRSTGALVQPGDEIKVFGSPAAPTAYFYVSGAINSPGQKAFHSGLTLTQAIIVSGGLSRAAAGKVKILRQGPDGKLITTVLNLRQIEAGKIADPGLLSGDRIAAL